MLLAVTTEGSFCTCSASVSTRGRTAAVEAIKGVRRRGALSPAPVSCVRPPGQPRCYVTYTHKYLHCARHHSRAPAPRPAPPRTVRGIARIMII